MNILQEKKERKVREANIYTQLLNIQSVPQIGACSMWGPPMDSNIKDMVTKCDVCFIPDQ